MSRSLALGASACLVALALLATGCRSAQWYFESADSPSPARGASGAKPYTAVVRVSTEESGKLTSLQRKKLEIVIKDGSNREMARDELLYDAALIEVEFEWADWRAVRVGIWETPGSQTTAADTSTGQGRRRLISLLYRYDLASDRFVRVAGAPGDSETSTSTP